MIQGRISLRPAEKLSRDEFAPFLKIKSAFLFPDALHLITALHLRQYYSNEYYSAPIPLRMRSSNLDKISRLIRRSVSLKNGDG